MGYRLFLEKGLAFFCGTNGNPRDPTGGGCVLQIIVSDVSNMPGKLQSTGGGCVLQIIVFDVSNMPGKPEPMGASVNYLNTSFKNSILLVNASA